MEHPQFSFELLLRRIVFQEAYLHPNDLVFLEFDEGKVLYSAEVNTDQLPSLVRAGDTFKVTITFVPRDSVTDYMYSANHLKVALLYQSSVLSRSADLAPIPQVSTTVELVSRTHQFPTSFSLRLAHQGLTLYEMLNAYPNLDDVLARIETSPDLFL